MILLLILLHVISASALGFQPSFGLDFKWLDALFPFPTEIKIEDVCWTKECFQVALNILNSMNASVNPCDNFYEFACGNRNLYNPDVEHGPWMTRDSKLSKLARDRLRDELENESSQEEILPVQQIKALYKSCMTMTQYQIINSVNVILQKANGWPMIMEPGTWNSSAITWREIDLYYQEIMGLNAFYDLNIIDQLSKHGQLKISMKKNLLKKPSRVRKIAIMLMQHNKVKLDKKRLSRELNELEVFADKLTTLSEHHNDKFFKNYGGFIRWWNKNGESNDPLDDIQFDWRFILTRLINIKHPRIIKHTPIWLMNVDYFEQLSDILRSTDKRIIVNFIHFQFILWISSLFIDSSLSPDDQTKDPRWLDCLNEKEPAAAHLFIRKYYGSNNKAAAEEIMENVKKSFEHQITGSNWLPSRLKNTAKGLVRNMRYVLGSEDWYMNETALIDYYKDLTIDDNYVESILRLRKHKWEEDIKHWGIPVKYLKWRNSAVDDGGENAVEVNYIYIPAAELQPPLLDIPYYSRYGSIGSGIGHEIGHDFDGDQSSFFKYEIIDTRIRLIFTKLAQCFIDSFDAYVNGSGKLTLAENLADWYGIHAALDAYKEVKDKKHPNGELKLPGLYTYTDLQMFFLSYAQYWCGGDYNWDEDKHHSNRYRVIGTLSNTEAFAKAFKCPKNSPMNPEKKCNIWMK